MNNILIPRNIDSRLEKHRRLEINKIRKYVEGGSAGDLVLEGTSLTKLPDELKTVRGSLYIKSSIIDLNKLECVKDRLQLLNKEQIESAINLREVGYLSLNCDAACFPPNLEHVDGLSLVIPGNVDLRNIMNLRYLNLPYRCGKKTIITLNENLKSLDSLGMAHNNIIFNKHNIRKIDSIHLTPENFKYLNNGTVIERIMTLEVGGLYNKNDWERFIRYEWDTIPENMYINELNILYAGVGGENNYFLKEYINKLKYIIASQGGIINKINRF